MRILLLIALIAFGVAACGGSEPAATADQDTAAQAAADATTAADAAQATGEVDGPPRTGVIEAEPVLEDYRGTPLAIVFFHPF